MYAARRLLSMAKLLMYTDNWSVLAAGPRVRTRPRAVRGEPGSRRTGIPANHRPVPTACPGGRVVPTDAADGGLITPSPLATDCAESRPWPRDQKPVTSSTVGGAE